MHKIISKQLIYGADGKRYFALTIEEETGATLVIVQGEAYSSIQDAEKLHRNVLEDLDER